MTSKRSACPSDWDLSFLVDTLILGILTILFMIYIHPLLTLYAILPMPLITIVTLFFSRLIHQRFETLQKTFSSLTERVRESISGIRVVKAYVPGREGAGKARSPQPGLCSEEHPCDQNMGDVLSPSSLSFQFFSWSSSSTGVDD